ncbi:MAG: Gx transporter family protein [Synergistaceae bacterium]
MKTKNIILTALFIAMAIVINIAENAFPLPLPGVKLGLANIFALTALILLGVKEAYAVIILRVVLVWLLTGNIFAFSCSMVGGLLAVTVMSIQYTKYKRLFSISGISISGAWAFNVGQILVATLFVKDITIMYYIIPLLLIGTATGWAVGSTAKYLCKRIETSLIKR